MIRCPIFDRAVPTGLTTEMIVFDSIEADLEIPLNCPACLKTHKWKPREAWIDEAGRESEEGRREPCVKQ